MLRVSRYVSITAHDSWPQDSFPPSIAVDVLEDLNKSMGIVIDPQLSTLLEHNISFVMVKLPSVRTFTELAISFSVYYTPVFHNQWVRYIASSVVNAIKKLNVKVESLWIEIRGDVVRFTYADTYLPRVDVYKDGILLIEVRSNKPIDKVLVEIADLNLKRIAGIAPPGYIFTNLKTVEADEWITRGGFVSIKVSLNKLRDSLGEGEYLLLVWVKESGWDEEKLCYVYRLLLS